MKQHDLIPGDFVYLGFESKDVLTENCNFGTVIAVHSMISIMLIGSSWGSSYKGKVFHYPILSHSYHVVDISLNPRVSFYLARKSKRK